MSSSINIPTKKSSAGQNHHKAKTAGSGSPSDSSYSSSTSSSAPSPSPNKSEKSEIIVSQARRPRLLSSAIAKSESTTINIGPPDGPPRLISYLSSSEGFLWNPELFLPSYIDCDYVPLENRRDPVHEIHLSDEEAQNMLPE